MYINRRYPISLMDVTETLVMKFALFRVMETGNPVFVRIVILRFSKRSVSVATCEAHSANFCFACFFC